MDIDLSGRPTLVNGTWMVFDANDWGRITGHELKVDARGEPIAHIWESWTQEIAIYDLLRFGLSLWIRVKGEGNGKFWPQLAWADEYIYHQLLVMPAIAAHPCPKRVLILGGGDRLAALRARMCRDVEEVAIVEWDPLVGQMVRALIPQAAATGIFEDTRVREVEADVRSFLVGLPAESHDIVIGDLVDIREFEAFMPNFPAEISRILAPGGIFATQLGEICRTILPEIVGAVEPFAKGFNWVEVAAEHIPSFAYQQGVLYCGKLDPGVRWRTPSEGIPPAEFAQRFDAAAIVKDRPFYCRTDGDETQVAEDIRERVFTLLPDVQSAVWKLG